MVFSGTIESDFLKLVGVDDSKKNGLINYAATDFITLRNALINYIQAVYPLDYGNFIESDLGMVFVELVAYLGSVISLKADMLANENYIRTSRQRNSVKKLLDLIGVRMKGPIAAAANAQLTFDSPPWTPGDTLVISPARRVINITSPEDGAPLYYTLYKVINGLVDVANATGNITLDTSSEADNETGSQFTNLVLLEGSLVVESGTFTEPPFVKTIDLAQSPVIEGSVNVYINGNSSTSGVYTGVENIFFASGESDKVYQLVTTDDYKASIVFGDNILGKAPAAGDTYIVTYRIGGGSRGNIKNEVINTTISVTAQIAGEAQGTLENISQGTGGADAETVDHARRYAPLTFKRQDRLVTLEDYKAMTNSFISQYGSTGKATASVRRAYSSANIIDVFVLEKASDTQLRRATPTFKSQLLTQLNTSKMLTDEIIIVDGLVRTLDLDVTITIDRELKADEETIKLDVKDKILDFFNIDANDFGKTFIAADLNRAIFELDKVRFSTINNVPEKIEVNFNEIIQLNNISISVNLI